MLDASPTQTQFAWRRHELLRVSFEGWTEALASRPALELTPLLQSWAMRGWPVVVRRPTELDPQHRVPVGVPLPPMVNERRVALTVLVGGVVERTMPPPLHDVQAAAEPAWLPTIVRLMNLGARARVTPRAYGSLFWKYRTGLPYLSATSDLDVLWPVADRSDVEALLYGIACAQRDAPMRIDGEITFPNGCAVQWWELYQGLRQRESADVLLRSMSGGRFARISTLPLRITGS